VGYAIEELYPDRLVDHYEELAHHFSQGEEWAKAFAYLVMSGDKAKNAYANQLALDSYAGALNAAQKVMPAVPAKRIMEIHQGRGEVWRLLSRYPEAIAESERMLDLARAAGDRRSEGEALLDLVFSYWDTFPWEHIPQTPRFAEEALAVAREIGDQHMLAKSLSHLGLIDQVHGNLAEGDRKYEESLRIGELGGFTDVISQDLWSLGSHANWRGARPRQTSARL
jgi:tetratricopeptide (TPR) repeat protein